MRCLTLASPWPQQQGTMVVPLLGRSRVHGFKGVILTVEASPQRVPPPLARWSTVLPPCRGARLAWAVMLDDLSECSARNASPGKVEGRRPRHWIGVGAMRETLSRLSSYWVYGGFLAGLLLLALIPELSRQWTAALSVVFLQLPIYMMHQFEEHDDDRFRRFFNRTIGGGHEVLSPLAVFVINVPGVWGLIVIAFYLSTSVAVGYGLIAVYLTLVNARGAHCTGHQASSLQPWSCNRGRPVSACVGIQLSGTAPDRGSRLDAPWPWARDRGQHSRGDRCLHHRGAQADAMTPEEPVCT